MKRNLFCCIICVVLFLVQISWAQLKIGTNGKVSIDGADPHDSRSLNIYNSQTGNYTYGIVVEKVGTISVAWHATGIYSYINTGKGYLKGIGDMFIVLHL